MVIWCGIAETRAVCLHIRCSFSTFSVVWLCLIDYFLHTIRAQQVPITKIKVLKLEMRGFCLTLTTYSHDRCVYHVALGPKQNLSSNICEGMWKLYGAGQTWSMSEFYQDKDCVFPAVMETISRNTEELDLERDKRNTICKQLGGPGNSSRNYMLIICVFSNWKENISIHIQTLMYFKLCTLN